MTPLGRIRHMSREERLEYLHNHLHPTHPFRNLFLECAFAAVLLAALSGLFFWKGEGISGYLFLAWAFAAGAAMMSYHATRVAQIGISVHLKHLKHKGDQP